MKGVKTLYFKTMFSFQKQWQYSQGVLAPTVIFTKEDINQYTIIKCLLQTKANASQGAESREVGVTGHKGQQEPRHHEVAL